MLENLVYYSSCLLGFIFYFCMCHRYKLKVVSFSTLIYCNSFILAILPGSFSYSQNLLAQKFPHVPSFGFHFDAYFLFLSYALLLPFGLILGRLIFKNTELLIQVRPHYKGRLLSVFAFFVVFCVLYFLSLPDIPLLSSIFTDMTADEVAKYRLLLTHEYGYVGKSIPVIFGYWYAIVRIFSVFFLFYLFSKFPGFKFKALLYKFFAVIFVLFFMTYNTEKAPLVFLIYSCLLFLYIDKKVSVKVLMSLAGASFVGLLVTCSIFMKITPLKAFDYIFSRIAIQTISTPLQMDTVELKEGHYDFDVVYMNYINEQTFSPNRYAYSQMYPKYRGLGLAGSAGGLSLGKLWAGFSWGSLLIFMFMALAYGMFDQLFLNVIHSASNSKVSRNLHKCFYCAVAGMCAFTMLGSVFKLIALPTGLPRKMYPILILYVLLFSLENIRLKKSAN